MEEARANLGRILKQQRVSLPLTLRELSSMAGVSASHLGRIERGERFPSGSVLRRIAGPLGFEEDELFTLAGYLSPQQASVAESSARYGNRGDLDPYVARVLAQEPVDVKRAVIGILSILNSIAKTSAREKKS
jgi:transcriptional regulator with XRE-family HTH domain